VNVLEARSERPRHKGLATRIGMGGCDGDSWSQAFRLIVTWSFWSCSSRNGPGHQGEVYVLATSGPGSLGDHRCRAESSTALHWPIVSTHRAQARPASPRGSGLCERSRTPLASRTRATAPPCPAPTSFSRLQAHITLVQCQRCGQASDRAARGPPGAKRRAGNPDK
jgi:hypothetical protein